jgi:hypothetical protein
LYHRPPTALTWHIVFFALSGSRKTSSKQNKQTLWLLRMVSSGLLRRVALVRTDVSEEPGASFINRRTLRRNTKSLGISSQRMSVASCSLCCS